MEWTEYFRHWFIFVQTGLCPKGLSGNFDSGNISYKICLYKFFVSFFKNLRSKYKRQAYANKSLGVVPYILLLNTEGPRLACELCPKKHRTNQNRANQNRSKLNPKTALLQGTLSKNHVNQGFCVLYATTLFQDSC